MSLTGEGDRPTQMLEWYSMFVTATDIVCVDERESKNAHEDKCCQEVDQLKSDEPSDEEVEKREDPGRKPEQLDQLLWRLVRPHIAMFPVRFDEYW